VCIANDTIDLLEQVEFEASEKARKAAQRKK
jgi:hypothetical protein